MYRKVAKSIPCLIYKSKALGKKGHYLRYYSSKNPFKPSPCNPCEPHLYKPNFSKPNYGKYDPCKPGSCKVDPCKPDPCKPDPCKPNPCQSKSCQPRQPNSYNLKSTGKERFAHCKDAFPSKDQPVKKDGKKNLILLIGLATILAAVYVVCSMKRICRILWKMGFFDSTPKPEVPQKKSRPKKEVNKIPSDSCEIPTCVPYLLIGGGTASLSAFRAIIDKDPKAQILVISNEVDLPYMRPPLSKELWYTEDKEAVENFKFKQWNGSEKSIFFETEDFYVSCKDLLNQKKGGVAVARGWTVVKIDTIEQKVCLDDGHSIEYGRCLIATGGTPKSLPVIDKASKEVQDKVILYRDISDFKDLDIVTKEANSITILGGGFLGSELACALAKRGIGTGMKVTQIFPEKGNMGKILPNYLSVWATDKIRDEGVEVMAETHVTGIANEQDKLVLSLSNGKKIKTDRVVVAVGIEPNTDLAEESGLEIDKECGGFLVNAELMARTNLWVAGDCSCFYDVRLGRRRIEHHDNAIVTGRLAGENMTGAGKPYVHQSMFWSDLGPNVGYEAVGILDSCLPTVGVFARATEKDTPKAAVTETGDNIRSETEMNTIVSLRSVAMEVGVLESFDASDVLTWKTVQMKNYQSYTLYINYNFISKCAKPSDDSVKPPIASVKQTKDGDSFGKGIVFYLRDNIVVGILLWNVFNRMNVAQQVLQEGKKYEDLDEVSKLFNIHETEL